MLSLTAYLVETQEETRDDLRLYVWVTSETFCMPPGGPSPALSDEYSGPKELALGVLSLEITVV